MSNATLSRIFYYENDTMLKVKMYCKHGDLHSLKISWYNPGRRFWSCPRYRENSCNFFDGGIVKMLIYDPSSLFSDWRTKLRSWILLMKVISIEVPNGE
ncbi:hypothetical protein EJD97_009440 [Solanum chilense]|uniref:GRF-type domain-containing protein n=1 Tax=Solanum chilense TaxID=4083 RepID=A0A6N2BQ06_SOLCI|nr:hypothetical protein EJD97_009440 [Solanum chilense]